MCGRFAFYSPSESTIASFGVDSSLKVEPYFNIAPTQYIAVIRNDNRQQRELTMLRWGLIPSWAKDPMIGNRMINARAETVTEKPSFRSAFRHRRCVVLTDGFYEWHKQGDKKIPHFISLASGEPFALAGIWENWKDHKSGGVMQTTALLTIAANDFMLQLHHRMPVILPADATDDWLFGKADYLENADRETPKLRAWPVSFQVNNVRNQGKYLIRPTGEAII
ncbi:MAG: SOS response-associated peptidase [Woeseiaceae bacterium]|nr:SOS response-associated peptidase [Woeseiaceae bacterium]